jgi:hypothetical protein
MRGQLKSRQQRHKVRLRGLPGRDLCVGGGSRDERSNGVVVGFRRFGAPIYPVRIRRDILERAGWIGD